MIIVKGEYDKVKDLKCARCGHPLYFHGHTWADYTLTKWWVSQCVHSECFSLLKDKFLCEVFVKEELI